jgi:ABC-2 type transport system permease protein
VVTIGFADALAYRGTFMLEIVFTFIPLVTSLLLWSAIYRAGGSGIAIAGFDLNQMLSYYIVMNILRLAAFVEDVQWTVTGQIKDGQLNAYLMRPVNYILFQWDLRMASVAFGSFLTLLPAAVLAVAARHILVVPATGWQWAAFGLSAFLGIQIGFLLSMAVGLSAFWVLETSAFQQAVFPIQMMLSGAMFPLELVPQKVFAVVQLLPWTYQSYFPMQVYLGRLDYLETLRGLGIQVAWILVLGGLCGLMWRRGVRNYGAVGG